MATATSSPAAASQLDVIFDGAWILVPSADASGKIIEVNIYSPACGHPLGVFFTNQVNPNPWPAQSAFYQLDSHSYTINLQRGSRAAAGMPISGINTTINHCVSQGRPIASNWDMLASIAVGPDAWVSSDTFAPQTTDSHGNAVPCFSGKDAPTGQVSSMQTLSFTGVTAVALLGAPANVQALLPAPWSGSGTLIFEDEIPYIPTLQHERNAIFAMANLAGLDLALEYPLPKKTSVGSTTTSPLQPMTHTGPFCAASILMMP
jgi:hypothetical protein